MWPCISSLSGASVPEIPAKLREITCSFIIIIIISPGFFTYRQYPRGIIPRFIPVCFAFFSPFRSKFRVILCNFGRFSCRLCALLTGIAAKIGALDGESSERQRGLLGRLANFRRDKLADRENAPRRRFFLVSRMDLTFSRAIKIANIDASSS